MRLEVESAGGKKIGMDVDRFFGVGNWTVKNPEGAEFSHFSLTMDDQIHNAVFDGNTRGMEAIMAAEEVISKALIAKYNEEICTNCPLKKSGQCGGVEESHGIINPVYPYVRINKLEGETGLQFSVRLKSRLC
jgi:hypothetical protein